MEEKRSNFITESHYKKEDLWKSVLFCFVLFCFFYEKTKLPLTSGKCGFVCNVGISWSQNIWIIGHSFCLDLAN